MQRLPSLFALAVCASLLVIGATSVVGKSEYDFRSTTWGMSRLEIILAEDALPNWEDASGRNRQTSYRFTSFDDDPLIGYLKNEGIDWIVTEIRYELIDDRLVAAEVWALPPIMNDPKFDHELLYDLLSSWVAKQHGEGHYTEHWKDGPKTDNKLAYIYVGELKRRTTWKTDRTIILLEQEAHVHLGTEIIRTSIAFGDRSLYE